MTTHTTIATCMAIQKRGTARPLLDDRLAQRDSDGSTNALPSATVRIARTRSSGGEPFITYPRAPAAIASESSRLSPYAEKITNFTFGAVWWMRLTAETP